MLGYCEELVWSTVFCIYGHSFYENVSAASLMYDLLQVVMSHALFYIVYTTTVNSSSWHAIAM